MNLFCQGNIIPLTHLKLKISTVAFFKSYSFGKFMTDDLFNVFLKLLKKI